MDTLLFSNLEVLNSVHSKVNALVDVQKRPVKEFFIDSLRNGYSNDSIGQLFEKSLEKFDRKDTGQYYTPAPIVKYMISELDVRKDSKILDPSCGCGSFLLNIFDEYNSKYGIDFIKNIFGVDINDNAINMTRLCLYKQTGFKVAYISSLKENLKMGNSLSSNKVLFDNAFDWDAEFPDVMCLGGFDFIIGNPPYVTVSKNTNFDVSESIYAHITEGPVNAATLMIGRSIELLKDGGVLAFLLPKSILYVDSYLKLRNYLAQNTEILQIYDLGSKFKDVRGEQFILFVRKRRPDKESKIKICVFTDNTRSLGEQPSFVIKQISLARMGKFLTYDDPVYYKFLNKLSNVGIKLDEVVEGMIFRGLPIGGNNVSRGGNIPGIEHVIRGKDISKFQLKPLPVLDKKLLNKQSKDKIKDIKNKKIVLQNIFSSESGVIAAYDSNKMLTLDTVTNLIVEDDEKGKYLLALLSSKLINFYIMYALFNRSRLTMHLDRSYIGSIPIVANPDKRNLIKIIKIMDILMNNENSELRKAKNRELDEIVYDIYSLSKKEIKLVEDAVSKILSKKSKW